MSTSRQPSPCELQQWQALPAQRSEAGRTACRSLFWPRQWLLLHPRLLLPRRLTCAVWVFRPQGLHLGGRASASLQKFRGQLSQSECQTYRGSHLILAEASPCCSKGDHCVLLCPCKGACVDSCTMHSDVLRLPQFQLCTRCAGVLHRSGLRRRPDDAEKGRRGDWPGEMLTEAPRGCPISQCGPPVQPGRAVSASLQVAKPHRAPQVLQGNAGEVTGVAWCPTDATQLVTCHDNATVNVWTLDRSRDSAPDDEVILRTFSMKLYKFLLQPT